MKSRIFAAIAAIAFATSACAQSSPGWSYGQVPTAAQWNAAFAAKQDLLGFRPINQIGDTMLGPLTLAPGTTSRASLRVQPGVAPTSPQTGDLWMTAAGAFLRVGAQTAQMIALADSCSGFITYSTGVGPGCFVTGSGVTYAMENSINTTGGLAVFAGPVPNGQILRMGAGGIVSGGAVPIGAIYASSEESNGYPAGDDATGVGSATAPFASMEMAMSAAAPGQPIICNGTFTPTSYLTIAASFSLQPSVNFGCTVQAQPGQTRIFQINPTGAAKIAFGKIVLDGLNDTNISSLISVSNTATTFDIDLGGMRLKNFYTYGLTEGSAGNFTLSGDVDCQGSYVTTCIYLPTHAAGDVSLGALTANVTQRTIGNGAMLVYMKTSASPGPTFKTKTLNIAGAPPDATGIYRLIRTINLKNVDIDGGGKDVGVVAMNSTSTQASCRPIQIESDTTVPLDSSGGKIHGFEARPNCAGGGHAGATIGFDGDPGVSYRNYANGGRIYDIRAVAGANVNSSNITEGLFCGWQTDCQITRVRGVGLYDLAEIKGCTTCALTASVGDSLTNAFVTIKFGSGNSIVNNLHHETTDPTSPTCFVMLNDGGIGSPTTGNYVANNIANYAVATTNKRRFVCQSGSGNTATFANNDWYNQSGLSSGYPFQYLSTTYSTVTGGSTPWTAIEPTAIGTDPKIVNYAAEQYGVQPGSPAAFGGTTVPAWLTADYTGAAFANPPSIGAVQNTGLNGSLYALLAGNNVFANPVGLPQGGLSAPALYLNGETTTGLYMPSSGIWGYVVAGVEYVRMRSTQLQVGSGMQIGWSSSSGVGTIDTMLMRAGGAGKVRQGAADAAAPVAQHSYVQSVVAGTSNTAGVDRTFHGSVGTGTGAGGSILFTVAPAGSSGSTQNTEVTALTISGANKGVRASGVVGTGGYTVSLLPPGAIGDRAYVTDATACTFLGSLTGGGATFCPVIYNGSAWVAH